jgi:uncharacterized protein (TIGR03083 family)
MDENLGESYADERRRISDLVRALSAADLGVRLPTCPDWTVRDVVGHMTGLMADVRSGNLGGLGTSAWTQAQVDAFADRSLEAVLADWAELAAPAEADAVGVLGQASARLVSDAFSHEHDIRGAVGRRGGRDSAALAISLRVQLEALATRLAEAGLPALALHCDDGGAFLAGSGEPGAIVQFPTTWEMLRCVTARRSRAQLLGLTWTGAPAEDYLPAFFRFAPPEHDIVE